MDTDGLLAWGRGAPLRYAASLLLNIQYVLLPLKYLLECAREGDPSHIGKTLGN